MASAWEEQPAMVQMEDAGGEVPELAGVFLTRETAEQKRPDRMRAWFGMNADELERRGVRPGLGVTGYKEGHRIGAHRFTARSMDDRAGTTALLLALQRIDPNTLDHRVIFTWSVQEEGGLFGAAALAERFAMKTRQAFSIDTFVSSDTPLESPHFAFAPLGDGPVLRSIENSSMAPPAERERMAPPAEHTGAGAIRPATGPDRAHSGRHRWDHVHVLGSSQRRAVLAGVIQSCAGRSPGLEGSRRVASFDKVDRESRPLNGCTGARLQSARRASVCH